MLTKFATRTRDGLVVLMHASVILMIAAAYTDGVMRFMGAMF